MLTSLSLDFREFKTFQDFDSKVKPKADSFYDKLRKLENPCTLSCEKKDLVLNINPRVFDLDSSSKKITFSWSLPADITFSNDYACYFEYKKLGGDDDVFKKTDISYYNDGLVETVERDFASYLNEEGTYLLNLVCSDGYSCYSQESKTITVQNLNNFNDFLTKVKQYIANGRVVDSSLTIPSLDLSNKQLLFTVDKTNDNIFFSDGATQELRYSDNFDILALNSNALNIVFDSKNIKVYISSESNIDSLTTDSTEIILTSANKIYYFYSDQDKLEELEFS
jgi:hypothetical protein